MRTSMVILALAVAACSPAALKREQEAHFRLEERVVELERQAQIKEAECQKQAEALERDAEQLRQVLTSTQQSLVESQTELAAKQQEVLVLTQGIERARAYLNQRKTTAPTQPATTPAPVSTADPRRADFVQAPIGSNPDLFPVYVYNVMGHVTDGGSHVEWSGSPSSKANVRGDHTVGHIAGLVSVNDAAFEIKYSVRNLTRTPKRVTVQSPHDTNMHTLDPDSAVEDQAVRAQQGDALTVTVNGESRQFTVDN